MVVILRESQVWLTRLWASREAAEFAGTENRCANEESRPHRIREHWRDRPDIAVVMIASPVLITGGAGFIGSYFVEGVITRCARVRVLDSLHPHVHGAGATRARHLPSDVERVHTSVCDAAAVDRALTGIASVVHLAAQVGVVQSMYAIVPYVDENVRGTAVLLDRLAAAGRRI